MLGNKYSFSNRDREKVGMMANTDRKTIIDRGKIKAWFLPLAAQRLDFPSKVRIFKASTRILCVAKDFGHLKENGYYTTTM